MLEICERSVCASPHIAATFRSAIGLALYADKRRCMLQKLFGKRPLLPLVQADPARARPHRSLGWQTPDEAYFGRLNPGRRNRPWTRCAVDFRTVGCADFRLYAERNPVDPMENALHVLHRTPTGRPLPTSSTTPDLS
jgi:hypothetical protein